MTPKQLTKQRDVLLEELERLVRMGNVGFFHGMPMTEIDIEDIKRAERVARRVRAAIAKARVKEACHEA